MSETVGMKDSGVEWIGEIPKEWDVKKLKYISTVENGATPSTTVNAYWNGDIRWFTPSDFKNVDASGVISPPSRFITIEGFQNCSCSMIKDGSLLLTTRAPVGNITKVSGSFTFNQGCKSIISISGLSNMDFLLFYFLGMIDELKALSNTTTFGELNSYGLKNFVIRTPRIEEQQHIAQYLNEKTEQIDALVEKIQTKIELLNEQRVSLINQCVTKGLDPNVEMKDSGVEWIGQIPKEWEIKKLKFVASQISEKRLPVGNDIKISPENVESSTGNILNYYSDYETQGQIFASGDILFNKLRVYLNKVVLCDFDGLSMGEMIVIRPTTISGVYLHRVLSSDDFIEQINSLSEGVKVPRPSIEGIFSSFVPNPSSEEQQHIAQYLDEKTEQIDTLVELLHKKKETLQEYRQSLISSVVTGKVRVTEDMV